LHFLGCDEVGDAPADSLVGVACESPDRAILESYNVQRPVMNERHVLAGRVRPGVEHRARYVQLTSAPTDQISRKQPA
jgi:hypothetical protein